MVAKIKFPSQGTKHSAKYRKVKPGAKTKKDTKCSTGSEPPEEANRKYVVAIIGLRYVLFV